MLYLLDSSYKTKRQRLEIQRGHLENERATFIPQWRDNADFILPRRPRFTVTHVNRGDRRNQKIIDSTGTFAAKTLRSGMMSGVTSPARPWIRLGTPDPSLQEYGPVKDWLYYVTERMLTVFGRSNVYNTLPALYGDLGVFGTPAMFVEEDFKTTLRAYSFPIGSFSVSNNERGQVDVFHRDFRMTVRQLVNKFGQKTKSGRADFSNFSMRVKRLWDDSRYEEWIDVCHAVQPNPEADPFMLHSKFKRYESVYYERGCGTMGKQSSYLMDQDSDRYLSESGYDYFPVLVPRWEVTGEDAYATDCPGTTAIGDIKQLQVGEKRLAQAIDKLVNPPMTAPSALRTNKASILPGDITYLDELEGRKGFHPSHEVDPRILELENKQEQVRHRIQRAFHEDLFLMLAQSDRREITAREIEERHEEKLLALGPVLEQLNQDLLDPLIDITFAMMLRQGLLPKPPPELFGQPLKVEYISIMAQAQKLVGIAGVERFARFAGEMVTATQDPSVLDKIDMDQLIETYGDQLSIPPGIIRPDEKVAQIKQQRQQQQQQAATAERLAQTTQAAKNLAGADTGGDNALTRLLDQAKAGQLAPTQ